MQPKRRLRSRSSRLKSKLTSSLPRRQSRWISRWKLFRRKPKALIPSQRLLLKLPSRNRLILKWIRSRKLSPPWSKSSLMTPRRQTKLSRKSRSLRVKLRLIRRRLRVRLRTVQSRSRLQRKILRIRQRLKRPKRRVKMRKQRQPPKRKRPRWRLNQPKLEWRHWKKFRHKLTRIGLMPKLLRLMQNMSELVKFDVRHGNKRNKKELIGCW